MKFADDTRRREVYIFRKFFNFVINEVIQLFVDLAVTRSFIEITEFYTHRGRGKSMGSNDDIGIRGISGVDAK